MKIPTPMKIVLQSGEQTYTVEGLPWDSGAEDLIYQFKELLVAAGYPASILNNEDGRWEWVQHD